MIESEFTRKLNSNKQTLLNLLSGKSLAGVEAEVKICVDFSSSMSALYSNGSVQQIIERLYPIGLAFNASRLDVYPFSDIVMHCTEKLTETNLDRYVRTNITRQFTFGGSNYAPAINAVVDSFLSNESNVVKEVRLNGKSGGKFGLFKRVSSSIESSKARVPGFVMIIADGDNFDKKEAKEAIANADKHGIFFSCVGIGSADFDFFRNLNKPNVNFFQTEVRDILQCSSLKLYNSMINKFPSWLEQSKQEGKIQ